MPLKQIGFKIGQTVQKPPMGVEYREEKFNTDVLLTTPPNRDPVPTVTLRVLWVLQLDRCPHHCSVSVKHCHSDDTK